MDAETIAGPTYRLWRREDAPPVGGTVVYVLQAGMTRRVKIGWTGGLLTRWDALQTGCPDRLFLLAAFPGTRAHERFLHERFAAARLDGEWFRRTAAMDRLIEGLQLGAGLWV